MKKYIKPISESVSLLFGSDVANEFVVSSKQGSGEATNRADFGEEWEDFEEE